MKIYGVAGWKNSGKTHLTTRLISEFVRRGLNVASIKHAHHDADIDQEGRDSHRHRTAGASQTILATPKRWALMTELRGAPEPPLTALLARLAPCDLVIIEGFKRDPHPKIEAHRPETGRPLLAPDDPFIRAVASTGAPTGLSVPLFHHDDTVGIADFILKDVGL